MPPSLLPFSAAFASALLAGASLFRPRRSVAVWCFFAAMLLMAAEAVAQGFAQQRPPRADLLQLESIALLAGWLSAAAWLAFSLTFSRGNYERFLREWRIVLAAILAFPIVLIIASGGHADLISEVVMAPDNPSLWQCRLTALGQLVNGLMLVGAILVLSNLEKTFRAAVGTMQWKIKFVVLGVAVIMGARVYTRTQGLLFSGYDATLLQVDALALLLGSALIAVAYVRSGLGEIDVYPSQAVLQSSVTLLLAGTYLFVVGVLAQLVARLGGSASFEFQALLVLAGLAVLGLLLLSDRLRQKIRLFISRHFHRPQHDSREVWKRFTQRTSNLLERNALCSEVARVTSETFQALSVTIWTMDRRSGKLRREASSGPSAETPGDHTPSMQALGSSLSAKREPFNLDAEPAPWAEEVRAASPIQFPHGGARFCVPLLSGERCLGLIVLADRVNGMSYTAEELDLLGCIGDQVAAALLNLELSEELMQARELEAFQTMATFFVHDLKNTASTLSLMLKNLPIHFDNPEFRADAIRGIANTVNRVNDLVRRLGSMREKLELRCTEWDLNDLMMETLSEVDVDGAVEVRRNLAPLPPVMADREQIRSVATNLLLNSREALGPNGWISIETARREGFVEFTVSDNGCGMSREFLENSLFRPFQTTKKKGMGIGMFQSRMIVEAHQGTMRVESEPGKGTTFRVQLPMVERN